MFLPFLQSPASQAYVIVRSTPRSARSCRGHAGAKCGELDPGLPVDIQTWNSLLQVVLFPSRVATMALGVLGMMGAMLSITGIFGMAAYSVSRRLKELGIRMALGAQRKRCSRRRWGAHSNCWHSVRRRGSLWEFSPAACWRPSCTRPRPAIRSYWREWFWPCHCLGCWRPGFRRSVR